MPSTRRVRILYFGIVVMSILLVRNHLLATQRQVNAPREIEAGATAGSSRQETAKRPIKTGMRGMHKSRSERQTQTIKDRNQRRKTIQAGAISDSMCTPTLSKVLRLNAINRTDVYQCQPSDVVLIHIPKTGGTSLEHAAKDSIYKLLWGFQYERERFRRIRRNLPPIKSNITPCLGNWGKRCCSWWHIPPREMKDWRPYFKAGTRFCVVRNPYARVLSEYSFSMGKNVRKLGCDQLNRTEVNVFLRKQMNAFTSGHRTLSDCHWFPQHTYVQSGLGVSSHGQHAVRNDPNDGTRSCNRVLRMENLTSEFRALMNDANLSRIKLSRKTFTSHCKDLAMLDEETRVLIRTLYRQDFVQFGYPM